MLKRGFLLLLVVLGVSSLACGFLQEEEPNVTYNTEIPVDFTVDASELCGTECKNQPSGKAPMKVPLLEVEQDLNIDIVEETGRTELREASGRFEEITITGIDYRVQQNSLTFPTPKTNIFLGPIPAKKHNDQDVFKLTTLPSVPAGQNESGTAPVSSAAESKASSLFEQLKMSTIPHGKPEVKKGQKLPPQGQAKIKMTIKVKFVASPSSATGN